MLSAAGYSKMEARGQRLEVQLAPTIPVII